jgi:hypothetical protein
VGLDIHPAALSDWVPHFVRVSNRLAGIYREPTVAEISAHRGLLAANTLKVENLEQFVRHVAGGAGLRETGTRRNGKAERSGLRADLETILEAAQSRTASPARLYRIYRLLRPFTDGNGRCGRALLMWQVMRRSASEPAIRRGGVPAHARPRTFRDESPRAMM